MRDDVTFTCPRCGGHNAEEVCWCDGGVSRIFFKDGQPHYGETHTFGDVSELQYQCADCLYVLDGIDNPEDFVAYCSAKQDGLEQSGTVYRKIKCPMCGGNAFQAVDADGMIIEVVESANPEDLKDLTDARCCSCAAQFYSAENFLSKR